MSLVVSVPTAGLARDLEPLPEGVEVIVWEMDAPAPRDRIALVVPPYMSGTSGFTFLAGVETQLVQGESIGYEGIEAKLPALEEDIKFMLIPADPADDKDIIVEIRAAAGGDEAEQKLAEASAAIARLVRS